MCTFVNTLSDAKAWAGRLSEHATEYDQNMLLDAWILGAVHRSGSALPKNVFNALYDNKDSFVYMGFRTGIKAASDAPEIDKKEIEKAISLMKDIYSGTKYAAILLPELEKTQQFSFAF